MGEKGKPGSPKPKPPPGPPAEEKDANNDEPARNVWSEMLKDAIAAGEGAASQRAEQGQAHLICVGDRKNGKSSLLAKFRDHATIPNSPEYILDYSYVAARNKYSQDPDEVLDHLNVWALDDEKHAALLDDLIKPSALKSTMFCLTVDFSRPGTIRQSLDRWTAVLTGLSARLLEKAGKEEQIKLKTAVSKSVQFFQDYVPPEVAAARQAEKERLMAEAAAAAAAEAAAAEAAKPTPPPEEAAEEEDDGGFIVQEKEKPKPPPAEETEEPEIAIDDSIPSINLGVPLVVVALRADHFERTYAGKAGGDDKLEFATQQLRKFCLQFGASLVVTSAVGAGTNVDKLQDLVYHTLFNLDLRHVAKASGTCEDFGLFVPRGFDSQSLISATAAGVTKQGWTDDTPFEQVFGKSDEAKASKEGEKVQAMSNDDFYKTLAFKLGNPGAAAPPKRRGSSRSGSIKPPPPASDGEKKSKAVKSFFNGLLKDKKKPAPPPK